jgi:hypothetical protein
MLQKGLQRNGGARAGTAAGGSRKSLKKQEARDAGPRREGRLRRDIMCMVNQTLRAEKQSPSKSRQAVGPKQLPKAVAQKNNTREASSRATTSITFRTKSTDRRQTDSLYPPRQNYKRRKQTTNQPPSLALPSNHRQQAKENNQPTHPTRTSLHHIRPAKEKNPAPPLPTTTPE